MAKYFARNIIEHAQKKIVFFSREIFRFASEIKKSQISLAKSKSETNQNAEKTADDAKN